MNVLTSLGRIVTSLGNISFGTVKRNPNNMCALLHDVSVPTKKATFAMGCFWGPDSLFGAMRGVVRTRVGYTGGSKKNPTYKSIGDHTEAIDIDFDPEQTSFEELLSVFWANHDPSSSYSQQYTSLILYHNAEQKELAEKMLKEEERKKGKVFVTKVLPFKEFYDGEDYHQKYRLQQHSWLMEAVGLKPGPQLKTSHLAARLNGHVVGFGGVAQFESEVERLGLDEKTAEYVRKLVTKFEGRGMTC
ncbi:peptide methionine sulfoxide reductase [Bacillus rossius redtenbacheri]|uniref:peptide methionine sulfoxide reductase n=1 Tax=Bacillus rossius redtenbacheri TaxID=93214 RepID=UPI002FDC8A8A